MKRFFQKMPGILKYGAALIAGCFYIWAIIILLRNDNWIGISTLTTMFLAIAAFWAIWQNYDFRKEDRKARVLDSILNWANEGLNLVSRIYRLPTTHENFPPVWEVIARLSHLESKGHLLMRNSKILKINDLMNVLQEALTKVSNCLGSHKNAVAMNVRLDKARQCEESFIKVLNKCSEIESL